MCSASSSTRNASEITTASIASPKSSGKRDMWTPFCAGSRSTVQSISAEISFSEPASGQLADLLEELSLAARIEGGRYDPALQETDSLALASAGAAELEPGLVSVEGTGAPVAVDVPAVERALRSLARCALRHGGL